MTQVDECTVITEELKTQLNKAINSKINQAKHFRDYYRNTGDKHQYNKLDGKVIALSDIRTDIDLLINEFCKKYKK
jgi:hypothetical protein